MIPVVWIEQRSWCWDQHMIDKMLSGEMNRMRHDFRHIVGFEALHPSDRGAVVVVPARYVDVEVLNQQIASMEWVLLLLTSDEESTFPWRKITHPNMRLWIMTPRPERHQGHYAFLGEYFHEDTRPILKAYEAEAVDKPLNWFFSGQVTHSRRTTLVEKLRDIPGGDLVETPGFTQGLDRPEYLRRMATAKVALCPSGPATPDSFRFYEALEAGCIPIVDNRCPAGVLGYWRLVFGNDTPFPVIDGWDNLQLVMNYVLRDWRFRSIQCSAWWQAYKRDLACRIDDYLDELGAPRSERGVDDSITVLIPTSPIPSNPDTKFIDEAVASVRRQLPNAQIIIMADGVRSEQEGRRADYEVYLSRLVWKANHEWTNVLPLVFREHLHQANMTRAAMDHVRTPFVLFVEHDTPLTEDFIDWAGIAARIEDGTANVVRFHHEAQVLDLHMHMMPDKERQIIGGVPIQRCAQWSQRPHLASTPYYRDLLASCFGTQARTMIEDVVHGVVDQAWREEGEAGWNRFKLWMYVPDGSIKRSEHTDGRAGDQKWDDRYIFEYDGPQPAGAPRATSERVD